MKLAFASDHAGYKLKNILKETAEKLGDTVIDFGTHSEDSVDYPDFIKLAARAVKSKEADLAVVVCGSGIGASIVANKIKGIRCALCTNIFMAKYSRLHNDANVLAIGARVTSEDDAIAIMQTWLSTGFEGGRHIKRIEKISELEN